MQKALLSAAIALILVLVTALVGPLFVDWGRYRGTFQTEIARLAGSEVRIRGPIDVRLLPVPILSLGQIEIGGSDRPAQVHARALRVELALGPLMHGEFVASNVALESPEISVALGSATRPGRPAPAFAFDPGAVSVAHLTIENGRFVVTGGPNGPLVLERVEFSGVARSLLGPAKGEGSVAIGGEIYLFALDAGRASPAGAVNLRLRVDTFDHARRADIDGAVSIDQGVPRIAGGLRWSRTARYATQGFNEPWRLTAKVRADWATAALDDIDLQYGADDRAVQFRGGAGITFRAQPEMDVTLAAGRVDLDRMLALPASSRRRPLAGVYAVADALGEAVPSVPVNLVLSANAVTLADAGLEHVNVRLSGKAGVWSLDSLDLQAPGGTQVRLSGRLDRSTPKGSTFEGEGRAEARDARPLVSWLTDGGGGDPFAAPFRAAGRVHFSADGFAFDHFSASFDRDTVEGSVAYTGPGVARAPRISATLRASTLDLERAHGLVQRAAGDSGAAWPREGSLSLNVERASVAGLEAKGTDISLRFNERALTVDRLTIDDLAGARLSAAGSVDVRTLAPRGAITFDLDLPAPDAVAAVVEKFSAQAAAAVRGAAGGLLPASLHGAVGGDVQAARAAGIPDGTSFSIDGSAGPFDLDLKGAAELPAGDGSMPASFAQLVSSRLAVSGRVDARDGRVLVEAAGLDRLVSIDNRPGRLDFKASGRPGGPMTATAQVTAGGLDVSLNGTLQAAQSQLTNADLALSVAQANVRVAQAGTLPAKFTARLNYATGAVGLDQIAGTIAGTDIAGRLAIGLSPETRVDGDIRLGTVDVPDITAAAIGAPAKRTGKWSAEPFAGGVLGQIRGRIAVATAQGLLTPNTAARNVRGTLNFGPSDIAFDDVEADMAGGHVSGRIAFERDGGELGVKSSVRFTNADAVALLPGRLPVESGRLDLDAELEGRGRSLAALIGSLRGRSSFRIENGRVAQLDPAAFDAVVRSADEGLPIEAARIKERVEAALARGALPVNGIGAITAADGKARLTARLPADSAELTVSARYDLAADALDARLTLAGPARAGAADLGRPEIAVNLQGPLDAPRRTLDVAALSGWLSMRAAAENAKRLAALPRPDDARPVPLAAPLPATPPQPAQPVVPANPPSMVRPLPPPSPPDAARPEATTSPAVTKPESAAGSIAAAKPESPANPAPAAKPEAGAARPAPSANPAAPRDGVAAAPQPVVPANPPAVARPPTLPSTSPDAVKPEAVTVPPAVTKPESATGAIAAAKPETPANAAKPDASVPAKPDAATVAKPAPPANPPTAARDGVAAAPPGASNPSAARLPPDPRMAELDRAIAANPRDVAALSQRGEMFAVRRDYSAAIRDFDEAIRLRPRDAEALNNRCWARAAVGDLQAALSDCNTALQVRPRYADALDSRGMINLKSGQLSDAIADFDAALQINPKLASSLYGRGIARTRTGNVAGGNLDIAGAKALQPNIAEEFAGYGIR